ncbi:MAG: DUF2147 domain-containing protein [Rhizobium sp.]|nr:DUF2147 domain-containing protein [Rhizobium sp.]
MKTSLLIASVLALGGATMAQAADLNGNWARSDGKARVKIAKCGGDICATNTWIKPGTPSEKTGDVLVMKIEKVAENQYSGSAFDPQRDRSYNIKLDVAENKMTTTGCILGGLLCKGVGWTRIN